jgi:hypothetical protein
MAPHTFSTHRRRPGHALAGFGALLVLLVGTLLASPVQARRDGDHERAREAVQAGEVVPLGQLLARLERENAGQVLEVELERDDGRWVYEIKLLQADGRLVKRKFDARDGAALDRRGRASGERQSDHEDPAR